MAKIITKNTSNKSNKTGANAAQNTNVFQRSITTEVKSIKTILTNNEKAVQEIKKTLIELSKKPLNSNATSTSNGKGDLHGATEDAEDSKKQAPVNRVNESIKALHKDLLGVLGLNNEAKKKSGKGGTEGDSLLSKLFGKIFNLGNLFKAALATLPIIFSDVIKDLIGKGLQKLGVGKELAGKIADYLGPAVQGAALGYALGGWKGALAGAAIAVGYKFVNEMIDKWKAEHGDDKVLGFLEVEGLGTLTKSVITGAAIGFGLGGVKGLVAGAAVGAVVGSVINLATQFKNDIENPQEQSTADMYGGLAQGAFYGAITGAVIGAKFGGVKGMLIGLAAGGIIGGAAGLIMKLISNFKATHAKDEEYNKNSEVSKAAMAGKRFTETDVNNTKYEISKLEEQLENENLSDEDRKKLERDLKNKKIDLDTQQNQIKNIEKIKKGMQTGKSTMYTTKDGKLVDMDADVGFWRGTATWLGRNIFGQGDMSKSEERKLREKLRAQGKSKEEIDSLVKEAKDTKLKEYNARRILNSELAGSSLTYADANEQEKLKAAYDIALETTNPNKAQSLAYKSQAKKDAALERSIDQAQNFSYNAANEQTELLRQIALSVGATGNTSYSYPNSSSSSTGMMSNPVGSSQVYF